MRIKLTSVIAVLCTLVYVGVIGIAAYRIYSDIQTRTQIAEQEFTDLVDISSSSAVLGFMEDPFKEAIHDALFKSKTLAAVIVSGPYGSEYALERKSEYLEIINNEFRFAHHFGLSSEPFFEPLRISGVRNASIQAVYEYIDFTLLYSILFNTLLALSGALAIGLLTLFIDILRSNKADLSVPDRNTNKSNTSDTKSSDMTLSLDDDVSFEIPDLSPEIYERNRTSDLDIPETTKGPFIERLSDELARRNPEQDDLVLLMIQLIHAGSDSQAVDILSNELNSFFPTEALIYAFSDQGFSIILPGTHLEKAFFMAEEFRSLYLKKFHSTEDQNTDLRIGLSSCSSRRVEAERLRLEAEEALRKSIVNNTAIVAFKNDPERYKQYLSRKKTQ